MAEHDSMPEVSISKGLRRLKVGYVSIRHEERNNAGTAWYSRCAGLRLNGEWLEEAGFTIDTPVDVRVLPGCLILTARNPSRRRQNRKLSSRCVKPVKSSPPASSDRLRSLFR